MGSAALLPPSIRDARTLALAGLLDRLDDLPLATLRNLRNPATCPASVLPYLAHEFGVLEAAWSLARTEAEQRALVGQALLWQRHRGTPWALAQVLTSVGWPGGVLEERIGDPKKYDGGSKYDGSIVYGGEGGWATFRVQFDLGDRTVSAADVALFYAAVDAWSPIGRHCTGLTLRLQLSGGLVSGKTAADATQLQAGSSTRPVLVSGNQATSRLRKVDAPGEDLRTFTLLDALGATVATVTRDIPLIHTNHILLIEWSL